MALTQNQTRGARAAEVTPPAAGISKGMVTLFAATAGLSAANTYYAQPLLTSIAQTFHVGSGAASWVVTAGPIGYALGLAFLVPLGDMVNRRKLVVAMLGVVAVFQLLAAAAPSLGVLIVAEIVAAVVSTVSPLMVSFAANLAAPEQRGRVTGSVMSGVLLGVLLARTAGGVIAEFGGWRLVYVVDAVVVAVLAIALLKLLPSSQAAGEKLGYGKLLGSAVSLLREEKVLRLRTAYGFFSQAGFQVLWTSLAFLLAKSPYHYNEGVIGLFGFAGLVGAIAARLVGRLADRGKESVATGLLLSSVLISWGLMVLHGGSWLIAILAGIVVLDFGVQGMQVMNLSIIYRLRPEARSRLTTAYMTLYLVGGIAGSAGSGWAYASYGWTGVSVIGAVFAGLALLMWVAAEAASKQRRIAYNPPQQLTS
ncbi:MFS transporter [Kitasatospora sp. NBC_01250]|uniref:MFS transporter n=1 Tax=unclassified Kitasatospora TaxID=2633591 RepID=UPI002E0FAA5F|nr:MULTISPECIES: MFS transporter [unclassified Kitasatospora]WSJ67537.1 MFS transporter [Kitasatospora sp. NBC_01302]